eukprot:s283_g5.t1
MWLPVDDGLAEMRFSCSWVVICVIIAPADPAEPCQDGEQVWAYFAGEVDFGDGVAEPCNPSMKECWFDAEVQHGPDDHGVYHVVWADATPSFQEVHGSQLLRLDSNKACGVARAAASETSQDRGPVAPTLLLRLHWEASDVAWRADAVAKLREDFGPEEVIDDFDWHVIMRFKHAAACEEVRDLLQNLVNLCDDPESCFRHPYVQAVDYEACESARTDVSQGSRLEL